MKRNNPALKKKFQRSSAVRSDGTTMSMTGTIWKTIALTLMVLATAAYAFYQVNIGAMNESKTIPVLIGCVVAALIIGLITTFVPKVSPYTAPIYAAVEGIVLGFISAVMEAKYPGIVVQATLATVSVLLTMLFLYAFKIIKPTPGLKKGIFIATCSVLLLYVVTMILQLCGVDVSFMHDSSPLSIGISLVVIGVAAFNFILDFAFIEEGSEAGLPKYMEWYGAFGLLVTLIWLYIEILDLIRKFRD